MLSKTKLILIACTACVCVRASAPLNQGADAGGPIPSEIQGSSTVSSDFEVKIHRGQFLVRRKGTTSDWKRCSEMNEPIEVGVLDGDQKVYLATKAIILPKPLHAEQPKYPENWRTSGVPGEVSLHFVVDNHGVVRFPKIDVSTAPEFTAATLDAVNAWRFQPATLDGQPVAVLVNATTRFRRAS
jgi:TonB family protein